MKKGWRPFVIALLGLTTAGLDLACAHAGVSGDRQIVETPRIRRRDRNPYFAARPVYPATPPGTRASITYEPFTRWYYPNEGSYYPPVNEGPSIPLR